MSAALTIVDDPADLAGLLDVHPALDPARVLGWFGQTGALLAGHFRLHSGRHAARFVRAASLVSRPDVLDDLLLYVPEAFGPPPPGARVVCSRSAMLAFADGLAARHGNPLAVADLDEHHELRPCWFSGAVVPGDRVYLVHDVQTSGASAERLEQLVRASGGAVAGRLIVAAFEPAEGTSWIVRPRWARWPEPACPLCASATPLVVGSTLV